MGKKKNTRIIAVFTIGLTILFASTVYFRVLPAITKSLLLMTLMGLFYLFQDPTVMSVCGAFGLVYVCAAGYMGYHTEEGASTISLILEWLFYAGIYGMVWRMSSKLKKLRETRDFHELIIAGTTAGLWKWKDMSNDTQWWSPRYYQLLGYENNEIPATIKNFGDLIHPDDKEAAFKVMDDYIAGRRSDLEFEYRIRTKSGEYKWFLGSGEVQFERNTRKPLRIVGSIINIDHKKQYELVLARQAALLALSPNAIITTDANFIVRSWNAGAEKIYNIKAAEAIGHDIAELYTTSYPYSTPDEVLSAFREKGVWEGEAHQVTKEGKKVYVLSSVIALSNTIGLLDGAMAVNSDISLLRVNKELSAALKMVENSTQYLEQLAYISSHDLKSPIITVQGLMNHLKSSKAIVPGFETTFEMTREIVEQMKNTSVSLTSILQLRKNLISREFASEKVAVGQVVRDVLEMLKGQIEASGAQINVDIEKGLQLRIHHTFLKSILYNLISNSIKFRHQDRHPVIHIKSDAVKDNVYILVSDNGSGINLSRYRNKLFSIFTRFHDDVEGNGIGLHSVKMIVDFFKGDINIDSEEGKGTTVTIKLPIAADGQN